MEEKKADAQQSVNAGSDETLNNGSQKTGDGDSGKSNYEGKTKEQIAADLKEKFKDATPDQLVEKLAEQMEIISHKNRAINSLKENKQQPAPASQPSLPNTDEAVQKLVDLALGKINEATSATLVEQRIKLLSADATEQQAIRDAYQNSIAKTGDVETDLNNAFAIANHKVIQEIKKNKSEAEASEAIMARFSSATQYAPSADNASKLSPKQEAAASNLRKLGIAEEVIQKAIKDV